MPAARTWTSRFARLRLLVAAGSAVLLFGAVIGAVPIPAAAYSQPTAPNYSIYVPTTWTTTIAYNAGFNASAGAPDINIVLDFGAQVYSGGWGVYLPKTTHFESDSWVSSMANNFASGYSANHTSHAYVYVGTNNDTGWAQGSSNWATAGATWGLLVAGLTNYTYATPDGGDEMESWYCSCTQCPSSCSWVAYGSDAETWVSNYQSNTAALMANYGTNGYAEDSAAWTSQQQVYEVSYGYSSAVPFPEIYSSTHATEWYNTWSAYPMTFWCPHPRMGQGAPSRGSPPGVILRGTWAAATSSPA